MDFAAVQSAAGAAELLVSVRVSALGEGEVRRLVVMPGWGALLVVILLFDSIEPPEAAIDLLRCTQHTRVREDELVCFGRRAEVLYLRADGLLGLLDSIHFLDHALFVRFHLLCF